jgi:alkylhydroperoxidase family enzyme
MSRFHAVDPSTATGKSKELLDAVKGKLGMVPNMTRVMASSPAVLESYLAAVRGAGFSEGEIAEILAHLALNVFTNYFNVAAQPEPSKAFNPVKVRDFGRRTRRA